jgi:hypothetical protein
MKRVSSEQPPATAHGSAMQPDGSVAFAESHIQPFLHVKPPASSQPMRAQPRAASRP